MKSNVQKYSATILKGYIEVLLFLPFIISAAVYLLPQRMQALWIITLPLLFVVSALITNWWRQRRVFIDMIVALIVGSAHTMLCISLFDFTVSWWQLLVCSFIGSYITYRGIKQTKIGWTASFHTGYMLIGLASYIVFQMLKHAIITEALPYNTLLLCCGVLSFFIFIILINERQINNESIDGWQSSAAIAAKKQNRTIMSLLLILFSMITVIFLFQKEIIAAWKGLVRWLFSWIKASDPAPTAPEDPPATNPQSPFEMGEKGEPAGWLVLLEQIAKVIAIIVAVVLIMALLYVVGKQAAKLLYRLWMRFMARSGAMMSDDASYIDEEEQLTMSKTADRRPKGKGQVKGRSTKKFDKSWALLVDNKEKVRLLYKTWILALKKEQRYAVKPHWTVRETEQDVVATHGHEQQKIVQSRLIDYYEAARYGDHAPSDEETETLKQIIMQPKK